MKDNLGICAGHELVSFGLKFAAQLNVIEDFPVKYDPTAAPISHRLASRSRQIEDRKTAVPEEQVVPVLFSMSRISQIECQAVSIIGTTITNKVRERREALTVRAIKESRGGYGSKDAAHQESCLSLVSC